MLLDKNGVNVVDWSFKRNSDTIWSWKNGCYVENKTKGFLACRVDANPQQMNQAVQDCLKLKNWDESQRQIKEALELKVGTLCDQGVITKVLTTPFGRFIDVQTENGPKRLKRITFKDKKRSLSICEGVCPVCMCTWGDMFHFRTKVGDEWVESDDGVLMCGLCAEACVDVPNWVENHQDATKRWLAMWKVNKPQLLLEMFKKW